MDNVLDVLDQTLFDIGQAVGSRTLLQCVWVYNGPIDYDGLRQFHGHLDRGRLSRCIARSPLPFGRSRWVASANSAPLGIAESARPRGEFDEWLDEQVDIPLDCEFGPGWRLAALPFTDGGTGVSLVTSHCLADGVGLGVAVADAARGRDDPVDWPVAGSRPRWRVIREDMRQTIGDIPAIGRAVVSTIRLGRRSRDGGETAPARTTGTVAPPVGADQTYTLPAVTILVDADEWNVRAQALGGTGNSLLVGLAARLARQAGRVASDGSVVVTLPVNERTPHDTRANAISGVRATVDTACAATDLRGIRAAVKQALIRHRQELDPAQVLNVLVPLLPRRLLKAARGMIQGTPFNLVGASNIGVIDAAAGRADGTDSDFFAIRLHHGGMSADRMQRYGGVQTLLSGVIQGRVFVSLVSYLPGRSNSKAELQQELSMALTEYSLTGTYL